MVARGMYLDIECLARDEIVWTLVCGELLSGMAS